MVIEIHIEDLEVVDHPITGFTLGYLQLLGTMVAIKLRKALPTIVTQHSRSAVASYHCSEGLE
jgi:hypothetical protein